MHSLSFHSFQGPAQRSPHHTCPKQQLTELERIITWEREYLRLLDKAGEARDFRAFSAFSSVKPPQHFLTRASQYRSAIDKLYRVYFCDWAPEGTALPPPRHSGPYPSQLAELTVKLIAFCPLPITADDERKARRDLEKSEHQLRTKHAELIDLDADTKRKKSIDSKTFLKKYNIWVKRCRVMEQVRKIKQDIAFNKATLSKKADSEMCTPSQQL